MLESNTVVGAVSSTGDNVGQRCVLAVVRVRRGLGRIFFGRCSNEPRGEGRVRRFGRGLVLYGYIYRICASAFPARLRTKLWPSAKISAERNWLLRRARLRSQIVPNLLIFNRIHRRVAAFLGGIYSYSPFSSLVCLRNRFRKTTSLETGPDTLF